MFDGHKVYRQEALEPVPTSDYHRSGNGILRQRSRDTPVLRRQIMEDTVIDHLSFSASSHLSAISY